MATAAAAVEDAITCCICFNVYRDPYALPCLHTLCKPCINQLAVRGKVECPECREESEVNKIRKDFKTQSLIDAHDDKHGCNADDKSKMVEVCGMCTNQEKVASSHCKECEQFMCAGCEQTHKAIKVCRGHTVKALKDIVQIAQSKLEACVGQWKMEKNKITIKSREIEILVKNVNGEAEKQIQETNKHFDKLIHDLEKKCLALVNEIREANEVSVQGLRKNKDVYDQLSREIQIKIDMLQEVINEKHPSTMNNMVDDLDESLKAQVIDISRQVDSLDVQGVLPVKLCIDKNGPSLNTAIKLEGISQLDLATVERSIMLSSDYSKLRTNRYKLNNNQHCNNENTRMCIIENKIWCAAWNNGIQIYDKNLQLIKKIKHENYSQVTGLAEWRGDIIVACAAAGLHQITQSGDYVQKIIGGEFSDVSSNGKYVYGLKRIKPHKTVIITHEKNKWTEKGEIPLQIGKKRGFLDKLIAKENSLFISLWEENCIEKYSLEGELQQTFGRGVTLTGGLNHPVISGVDNDGNLLVADVGNKQLKVYYSKQKIWHVVPLELDIKPFDAVMDGTNIWVVTYGTPSQILKFTKV